MSQKVLFTAMAVLLMLTPVLAQRKSTPAQVRNTLAGCLSGVPGNLTLGAVPSGDNYNLRGNTAGLSAYLHELVSLTGVESAPASSSQSGTFTVQKFEALAGTCMAPLPPQNPEAVLPETGEAGIHQTAINTTTTQSAGRITPGYETEAGEVQKPGQHSEVRPGEQNRPPTRGKLAPPAWGQVGQSEEEANRDATAAERAEEVPAHTLGVNALPSYDKSGSGSGGEGR